MHDIRGVPLRMIPRVALRIEAVPVALVPWSFRTPDLGMRPFAGGTIFQEEMAYQRPGSRDITPGEEVQQALDDFSAVLFQSPACIPIRPVEAPPVELDINGNNEDAPGKRSHGRHYLRAAASR